MTSGPTPSPGAPRCSPSCRRSAALERADLCVALDQKAELIDSIHEQVAGECLERKADGCSSGQHQRRRRQVNANFRTWVLDEPAGGRRVDDHRQEAVLQGIAAEDVGDLRADDGAKAIIEERPGRMLARGAAAEVAARDEDAAIAGGGAVEDEVLLRRAFRVIAPVGEEVLAQAIPSGRRQEARGNDLIVSILAAASTTVRERRVRIGSYCAR